MGQLLLQTCLQVVPNYAQDGTRGSFEASEGSGPGITEGLKLKALGALGHILKCFESWLVKGHLVAPPPPLAGCARGQLLGADGKACVAEA